MTTLKEQTCSVVTDRRMVTSDHCIRRHIELPTKIVSQYNSPVFSIHQEVHCLITTQGCTLWGFNFMLIN